MSDSGGMDWPDTPLRKLAREKNAEIAELKQRIAELEAAINGAIEQAQDEGHHRYRGTDTPKPFFETLWYAAHKHRIEVDHE